MQPESLVVFVTICRQSDGEVLPGDGARFVPPFSAERQSLHGVLRQHVVRACAVDHLQVKVENVQLQMLVTLHLDLRRAVDVGRVVVGVARRHNVSLLSGNDWRFADVDSVGNCKDQTINTLVIMCQQPVLYPGYFYGNEICKNKWKPCSGVIMWKRKKSVMIEIIKNVNCLCNFVGSRTIYYR